MSDPTPHYSTPLTTVPEIVERYRQGVPVTQLAADARRSYQTIYNWMIRAVGPEWQDLKDEVACNRVADAEYERDTASTQLEYARARDKCKDYRDDLKRISPHLYSDKQQLNVDLTQTIIVNRVPVPQPVVCNAVVIDGSSEVIDNREKLEHNS